MLLTIILALIVNVHALSATALATTVLPGRFNNDVFQKNGSDLRCSFEQRVSQKWTPVVGQSTGTKIERGLIGRGR